jgi:hypothetical protein
MLTTPQVQGEPTARQGSRTVDFADLRRQLGSSSRVPDGHRQRLLELERRLARIQAMGSEYRRVGLSDHVMDRLNETPIA